MDNKIILDIPFTTLKQPEVLQKIVQNLQSKDPLQLFIATPNPEMLLECKKNPYFKKILQNTSLNLPDGNGIIWANIFNKKRSQNKFIAGLQALPSLMKFAFHKKNESRPFNKTIHGSDLTLAMICNSKIAPHGFFLLGNKFGLNPETAKLTTEKLQQINPKVNIAGYYDTEPSDKKIIAKINDSHAEILLVGFGAPKQEIWLAENLPLLPNIKIAIGIGGTFDFISGIVPRAPKIMRNIGLEWLFRLYKQPKRIKRIYNAAVVFPIEVIKKHQVNPDKSKTSDI